MAITEHRLRVFDGDEVIVDEPIGVGRSDRPTPGGIYYLKELLQPPGANSVYGTYAYGLSGFSNVLQSFNGGAGVIGLHGTNDPSSIGGDVSSGCIRMQNDVIERLVERDRPPAGHPGGDPRVTASASARAVVAVLLVRRRRRLRRRRRRRNRRPPPSTPPTSPPPRADDGSLPPAGALDLEPIYGDALAELGLKLTDRGGLIDRSGGGYVPSAEGNHLALYVEPIDDRTTPQYIDGIRSRGGGVRRRVRAVVRPRLLRRVPGARGADDPSPEPLPVTQIELTRAEAAAFDWDTVTVVDLVRASLRRAPGPGPAGQQRAGQRPGLRGDRGGSLLTRRVRTLGRRPRRRRRRWARGSAPSCSPPGPTTPGSRSPAGSPIPTPGRPPTAPACASS